MEPHSLPVEGGIFRHDSQHFILNVLNLLRPALPLRGVPEQGEAALQVDEQDVLPSPANHPHRHSQELPNTSQLLLVQPAALKHQQLHLWRVRLKLKQDHHQLAGQMVSLRPQLPHQRTHPAQDSCRRSRSEDVRLRGSSLKPEHQP